nr:unnamed protein product [Spirometra erinaceieuropaei]
MPGGSVLCVSAILLMTTCRVTRLEAVGDGNSDLLVFHYILTEERCGSDFKIFNFADSLLYAIDYIDANYEPRISYTPYFDILNGCSLRDEDRAGKLMNTMHIMSTITLEIAGFSVLLGPPLTVDCDLVNDWISLGVSRTSAVDRLYQISYACRSQSQVTVFTKLEEGSQVPARRMDAHNFAAISLVLTTSTLVMGLSALLSAYGWQDIAVFYEVSLEGGEIASLAQQIALMLALGDAGTGPFNVVRRQRLRPGMDHSALLEDKNSKLDVIILLTRPTLAREFLIETRNVTAIRQGKIAIIHIEPTDMLTYDVLRLWRNELERGIDLGASGQCLIIMTALPTGTAYQSNSSIYEHKINLAAATAAGLAMRLTQLNVEAGGGKLDPTKGLFAPMRGQDVYVPITPEITFHFENYGTNEIRGLYDMFIFSLNLDASSARQNVSEMTFEEIFLLTDVILWPLVAVQSISPKVWPEGSSGPNRNPCLIYDCEMTGTVQAIALILLGGFIILGVTNLARIIYGRHLRKQKKVLGGNAKLILYADDISYVKVAKQASSQLRRDNIPIPVQVSTLSVNSGSGIGNSTLSLAESEQIIDRNTAVLNGEPIHIKRLAIPNKPLKSKMIDWLRTLRDVRSENVNVFIGCLLDADSFNAVFEYCSRGSVQVQYWVVCI